MKLGTENKKSVYALVVLGVVAAYMVYSQFFSGPSYPSAPAPKVNDNAVVVPSGPDKPPTPNISQASEPVARPKSGKNGNEFHPVLRAKKPEDRVKVSDIDPRLRLDLLAKVMQVPPAGGERDLFQILKGPPVHASLGPEIMVKPAYIPYGPAVPPPPPPAPVPQPPPPPPPIPLKYYAYSALHPDGKRTAYFQDGDDIYSADEGTLLKGRYRVITIGIDKVLIEDTSDKHRQSVNIEPEAAF